MPTEHWLYTIPLRLRSLFRWAQADQELDDELRDHLERKTEEYVAKGMTQEQARRRADQREMPRRAQSKLDSRLHTGFALRSAHVAQIPRLHRRRRAYPRPRHRREHGDFLRRSRNAAQAAALRPSGTTRRIAANGIRAGRLSADGRRLSRLARKTRRSAT